MKTLRDPGRILQDGLTAIRAQYQLPSGFPDEVIAEAEAAVKRPLDDHADRTDMHFVTLDPAASRDLDQAFSIEAAGSDIVCHYAIADVGWFVDDGGAMDREAWARGTSQYLPDGKVPLYPPAAERRRRKPAARRRPSRHPVLHVRRPRTGRQPWSGSSGR